MKTRRGPTSSRRTTAKCRSASVDFSVARKNASINNRGELRASYVPGLRSTHLRKTYILRFPPSPSPTSPLPSAKFSKVLPLRVIPRNELKPFFFLSFFLFSLYCCPFSHFSPVLTRPVRTLAYLRNYSPVTIRRREFAFRDRVRGGYRETARAVSLNRG